MHLILEVGVYRGARACRLLHVAFMHARVLHAVVGAMLLLVLHAVVGAISLQDIAAALPGNLKPVYGLGFRV